MYYFHEFHQYLYDVNIVSTSVRLLLAVTFGGIIGLERGANKHPAGFRTHILVCVGACLAMLTNQYIFENISNLSDPARLGAQVITGVGFLGVGTIMVTGRHKIKGLTTAAGLWASACLGLALGIGFYSGAIIAALLIFISLALLPRVENHFYRNARVMDLYIEIDSISNFKNFRSYFAQQNIELYETHLSHATPVALGGVALHISIKIPKNITHVETLRQLEQIEGVYLIEEI